MDIANQPAEQLLKTISPGTTPVLGLKPLLLPSAYSPNLSSTPELGPSSEFACSPKLPVKPHSPSSTRHASSLSSTSYFSALGSTRPLHHRGLSLSSTHPLARSPSLDYSSDDRSEASSSSSSPVSSSGLPYRPFPASRHARILRSESLDPVLFNRTPHRPPTRPKRSSISYSKISRPADFVSPPSPLDVSSNLLLLSEEPVESEDDFDVIIDRFISDLVSCAHALGIQDELIGIDLGLQF